VRPRKFFFGSRFLVSADLVGAGLRPARLQNKLGKPRVYPKRNHVAAFATALCILLSAIIATPSIAQKPDREQQLDKNLDYVRDPITGELRAVPKKSPTETSSSSPVSPGPVIRSQVSLVETSCSAFSAAGDAIRNLTLQDFKLAADGQQQKLEHFDASTEPAHLALVLDASPSEFHSLSDMKAAALALTSELSPKDQVAVVAFAGHPHMLVPFTADRKKLDDALEKIELMRAVEETGSNIYGSVYLTAQRLFTGPKAPTGRKAILLLTDGQDSALGLSWNPASMFPPTGALANRLTFEDVVRELATSGIEVFIASTENRPRGMTNAWFSTNSAKTFVNEDSRTMGIPAYTIFLAELVRRAGGGLYFLRESGTLSDVYRRIGATLRTQYIVGFYPSPGADARGWHNLTITLSDPAAHPNARLDCRPSYYIASPK
jgi:Ca-activated chloride channel family protein